MGNSSWAEVFCGENGPLQNRHHPPLCFLVWRRAGLWDNRSPVYVTKCLWWWQSPHQRGREDNWRGQESEKCFYFLLKRKHYERHLPGIAAISERGTVTVAIPCSRAGVGFKPSPRSTLWLDNKWCDPLPSVYLPTCGLFQSSRAVALSSADCLLDSVTQRLA